MDVCPDLVHGGNDILRTAVFFRRLDGLFEAGSSQEVVAVKCWCWSTSSSLGFRFIFLRLNLRGDDFGQNESKDGECKASKDGPQGKKQHPERCFEKIGDGKITCCRFRPRDSQIRSKENDGDSA